MTPHIMIFMYSLSDSKNSFELEGILNAYPCHESRNRGLSLIFTLYYTASIEPRKLIPTSQRGYLFRMIVRSNGYIGQSSCEKLSLDSFSAQATLKSVDGERNTTTTTHQWLTRHGWGRSKLSIFCRVPSV